jgi:hypothetical protein
MATHESRTYQLAKAAILSVLLAVTPVATPARAQTKPAAPAPAPENKVEALFKQLETVNQMPEGSMSRLFDADPKMRAKVLASLPESQVLSLVGDSFVKSQAKYLQTSVLPEETGFYVDSIKPDPLAVLDFSDNYFDEGGNDRDWNAFVGEILGEGAGWSGLAGIIFMCLILSVRYFMKKMIKKKENELNY